MSTTVLRTLQNKLKRGVVSALITCPVVRHFPTSSITVNSSVSQQSRGRVDSDRMHFTMLHFCIFAIDYPVADYLSMASRCFSHFLKSPIPQDASPHAAPKSTQYQFPNPKRNERLNRRLAINASANKATSNEKTCSPHNHHACKPSACSPHPSSCKDTRTSCHHDENKHAPCGSAAGP